MQKARSQFGDISETRLAIPEKDAGLHSAFSVA